MKAISYMELQLWLYYYQACGLGFAIDMISKFATNYPLLLEEERSNE